MRQPASLSLHLLQRTSRANTAPGRWRRPRTRCGCAAGCARAASSAGMMASRKCSNGILSRKKNDSLVVIASTTSTISASASGALQLRTSSPSAGEAGLAGDRQQPALDQILLVGRQHEAGALLQQLAEIVVVERRHDRSPRNRRTIFGAISIERQHRRAQPGIGGRARHAPDHARRLVLRDHAAAGRDDIGGAVRCRRSPCR